MKMCRTYSNFMFINLICDWSEEWFVSFIRDELLRCRCRALSLDRVRIYKVGVGM